MLFALAMDFQDHPDSGPTEVAQVLTAISPPTIQDSVQPHGLSEVKPSSWDSSGGTSSFSNSSQSNLGNGMVDEVDNVITQYNAQNGQLIILDDLSVENGALPAHSALPGSLSGDAKYVEVTVKRGDVLERIARAHGSSVQAIVKMNNLSSEKISVGQVLRIPPGEKKPLNIGAAEAAAHKWEPKKEVAAGEPVYYTIKSGDNPWKIARQFHVKFDDLLRLNSLDEAKARNLKVGDKIRVK